MEVELAVALLGGVDHIDVGAEHVAEAVYKLLDGGDDVLPHLDFEIVGEWCFPYEAVSDFD